VLADRILALVRFAPLARLDEVPNRDARERLLRILEATRQRLLELSETITRAYFSHVRTPHSVGYGGVRP
jgi:hypothetical protein